MLCNTTLIHLKIGFYVGHETMENGEKSYVDRRSYVNAWSLLHLIMVMFTQKT